MRHTHKESQEGDRMELTEEECERCDLVIQTYITFSYFCCIFYAALMGVSLKYLSIGWAIFNTFAYGVVSLIALILIVDRVVHCYG
tara:strand:- start:37751 stop:38008 length:258 start_codon:yes stop_codon:yes gene_type:complete